MRDNDKVVNKNFEKVNSRYYDLAQTDRVFLWTGELSVCKCRHHVEEHCTICNHEGNYIERNYHCHKCDSCNGFVSFTTKNEYQSEEIAA
jgi:hypothetical protein